MTEPTPADQPGPPPIRSGLVQFHPDLAGILAPIDQVQPHPENANNGDLEAICASIETNGMYNPIKVQKSTGFIVAGNHTWQACKMLDATEVPIIYLDLDDTQARRIMLADNKIAALAMIDPGLELNLLEAISHADSLLGTGYTDSDLVALRALSEIPANADDFAQWPLINVRVPPHVRNAYMRMTTQAVGDRERFELMLRLAGWDGK